MDIKTSAAPTIYLKIWAIQQLLKNNLECSSRKLLKCSFCNEINRYIADKKCWETSFLKYLSVVNTVTQVGCYGCQILTAVKHVVPGLLDQHFFIGLEENTFLSKIGAHCRYSRLKGFLSQLWVLAAQKNLTGLIVKTLRNQRNQPIAVEDFNIFCSCSVYCTEKFISFAQPLCHQEF